MSFPFVELDDVLREGCSFFGFFLFKAARGMSADGEASVGQGRGQDHRPA
jgi:hypothetical protein